MHTRILGKKQLDVATKEDADSLFSYLQGPIQNSMILPAFHSFHLRIHDKMTKIIGTMSLKTSNIQDDDSSGQSISWPACLEKGNRSRE